MGDETIYFTALERLSFITSGSSDFQKICLVLIKFMYPTYDFEVSEGGEGTKDGGYDGHASLSKAKLACSLEKDYKRKIKSEVEKSKKNSDKKLFYLSNQIISEPDKNRIKADPINEGIELIIFGIDVLSRKLENYFQDYNDPELYDLLCLSSLKVGVRYRRGDVKRFDPEFNGNMYKKRIVIIDKNQYFITNPYAETIIGENPLLEYILSGCLEKKLLSFKNIALCGIGYLGKSFLMKMTFDNLIDKFSDKNSYFKFQFLPFIQFRELKYYSYGAIEDIVKNNTDPLIIFLDGLDELSESKRIDLNNEIQNVLIKNNSVRFIVAGRNSSFFDFDIFSNSVQLYLEKYIDYNDKGLMELMKEYDGTPIADLLPIPTYRNFVLEKVISKDSKLEEFYKLLVKDNLDKDRRKSDRSNNISQRMTSVIKTDDIIKEISEFCYKLFINKRNVFTESELKEHIIIESHFIFIINSAIIDYHDENNISFISNFYYEYFVSNALLSKSEKIITKIFFSRGKIKILYIDLLVFFMNCAKTKSRKIFVSIKRKMLKDDIVCILLCEFDSLTDKERYEHFLSIFKEYKKEKKDIYYGRFRQVYGPLKNISNMAQRMQQLLPCYFRTDGINYLKSEIINFLHNPSKEYAFSFGNAVILLIPFIKDLWTEREQKILREMAVPIIQFFLDNDISKKLKSILSEKFIFDWYKMYNWTTNWKKKDWELFYEEIYRKNCDLWSEIVDEFEFKIKFDIFMNFYNNDDIKLILFPILRYAMKNMYLNGNGMATVVPEMISDEYETPLIKTDDRLFILSDLLKKIELNMSVILDLLIFAIENELYQQLKDSYDNPINILEEKLYCNLAILERKDYKKFTQYYFNTDEYGFDDRIFQKDKDKENEALNEYLVIEIINTEIKKWQTCHYLHKLIDFSDNNHSLEYLKKIKDKVPENIYKDVVNYIFYNGDHILNKSEFIINEYNRMFKEKIKEDLEKEKILKYIEEQIESVNQNDITLMLDYNEMINQLRKINEFLLSSGIIDRERKPIGKLFSLNHEAVKNIVKYSNIDNTVPPIFSKCAIKIMEDFYRKDILDIDKIIKKLQENTFKENNFYIYFYWVYIANMQNKEKINIKFLIDTYPNLLNKILDSLDIDASNKFINESLSFFENYNNKHWLIPFFYYYENILNSVPPEWLKIEHILKLIVVLDPSKSGGVIINNDLSLDWLLDKFPIVNSHQLIEFGLKNIENVTLRLSRLQIANYFIDFYKSSEKSILTQRILDFIISATKKLFDLMETNHEYGEFYSISQFWTECKFNYIDCIFPKISVGTITSVIRKNEKDFDYHYRKTILLYCSRLATFGQKTRIIHDIEKDLVNKELSDIEKDEVHGFLASLGREKSIRLIISSYLSGKAIKNRFSFDRYPLGILKQNSNILKDFIKLFIYSTEKSNDRRDVLLHIAQDGIKWHITKKSFRILERSLIKEIKKLRKQSSWQHEFYSEFLLQMEQLVFVDKNESRSVS